MMMVASERLAWCKVRTSEQDERCLYEWVVRVHGRTVRHAEVAALETFSRWLDDADAVPDLEYVRVEVVLGSREYSYASGELLASMM